MSAKILLERIFGDLVSELNYLNEIGEQGEEIGAPSHRPSLEEVFVPRILFCQLSKRMTIHRVDLNLIICSNCSLLSGINYGVVTCFEGEISADIEEDLKVTIPTALA